MSKVTKYDHPGQPAYFTTAEEMQIAIDKYFKDCDGEPLLDSNGDPMLNKFSEPVIVGKKPYTVTGLAIALGFTSRQALINYQHKDEFFDTIVRAKLKCQNYAESRLFDKEGSNGAKFSLSNNFGIGRKRVRSSIPITNTNTAQIDLSGFSIDELKQLIASTEQKLIEADYTATDE